MEEGEPWGGGRPTVADLRFARNMDLLFTEQKRARKVLSPANSWTKSGQPRRHGLPGSGGRSTTVGLGVRCVFPKAFYFFTNSFRHTPRIGAEGWVGGHSGRC